MESTTIIKQQECLIDELKGKLEKLTGKYKIALEGAKPVTSVKIFEYLYDHKFFRGESETSLFFTVNDNNYQVITSRLPFMTIRAVFNIPADRTNDFELAACEITESKHMVKAYVYDNRLIIDLQSYERDCRHFYRSFEGYIWMIDRAQADIAMMIK